MAKRNKKRDEVLSIDSVDSRFDKMASGCTVKGDRESTSVYRYFLEGWCWQRRKTAIWNYFTKIRDRIPFNDVKTGFNYYVDREFLPAYNYNLLDSFGALRLAASIWMLEKLRACGKLEEAKQYMFLNEEFLFGKDAGHMFYVNHPMFSQELVEAMYYTITFRYQNSLDSEYSNRLLKYNIIPDGLINGTPLNDSFKQLLDLLPKDAVETVCKEFKDKLLDILDISSDISLHFDNRINQFTKSSSFQQYSDLRKSGAPFNQCVPDVTVLEPKSYLSHDSMASSFFPQNYVHFDGRTVEMKVVHGLMDELKSISDCLNDHVCYLYNYLSADRDYLMKNGFDSEELIQKVSSFSADDPFGLCFALIYLLDQDDDAPWLMYYGGVLISYAYEKLPWSDHNPDEHCRLVYVPAVPEIQNYTGIVRYPYEMDGAVLYEIKDPEPLKYYESLTGQLNPAQILYRLCGLVVPYGISPFKGNVASFEPDDKEPEKLKNLMKTASLFLCGWNRSVVHPEDCEDYLEKRNLEVVDDETEETDSDDCSVEELNRLLTEERNKNKGLRKALVSAKSEAEKKVKANEAELSELRKEHRELVDLRELMFSLRNDSNVNDDLPDKEDDISFPYTLHKRMVVFGGHNTFVNTMKSNFPDLQFVDTRNTSVNSDMIKKSDIVWIQNNCISHVQYWNVIHAVSLAGVQVRYFVSAGTNRCSRQVVEADMEGLA